MTDGGLTRTPASKPSLKLTQTVSPYGTLIESKACKPARKPISANPRVLSLLLLGCRRAEVLSQLSQELRPLTSKRHTHTHPPTHRKRWLSPQGPAGSCPPPLLQQRLERPAFRHEGKQLLLEDAVEQLHLQFAAVRTPKLGGTASSKPQAAIRTRTRIQLLF